MSGPGALGDGPPSSRLGPQRCVSDALCRAPALHHAQPKHVYMYSIACMLDSDWMFGLKRVWGPALCVAAPGTLCLAPALCVRLRRSARQALALSVWGPALSVSGRPRALNVRPERCVSGPTLCVRSLCRALAPVVCRSPTLCVAGSGRSVSRRSLCRAPVLSVSGTVLNLENVHVSFMPVVCVAPRRSVTLPGAALCSM